MKSGFELGFVLRAAMFSGIGFDILVKAFVRVKLWGIGWKIENLDLIVTFLKPGLDFVSVMHPVVVDNQKNLLILLENKPRQKFLKDLDRGL